MATFYVNAQSGDDAWNGTSPTCSGPDGPKKHISAMLAALTLPLTEETTIQLQHVSADDFSETSGDLAIENILCGPGGSLIIEADDFNESWYEDGLNPFTGSGDMDPRDQIATTIADPVSIANCRNLTIRGLHVQPAKTGTALAVSNHGEVQFVFCRMEKAAAGVGAVDFSKVTVENSSIDSCGIGVAAANGAALDLVGNNFVVDSSVAGVAAQRHATVAIQAWDQGATLYNLEISTTAPRKRYCAIYARLGAAIIVLGQPDYDTADESAQITILKKDSLPATEYFGVKLLSGAMLSGSGSLVFRDTSNVDPLNDGKDTVPFEQQVVALDGQGTVVVE